LPTRREGEKRKTLARKEQPMAGSVFLFPGQGAQKLGMGRQLYDSLPAARQLFDEASEILGYSLTEVCWNGPVEKLNSTVISQPALFVASLAALEALRASEPQTVAECQAAAGLSLGEYTALTFAGALSFRDGLKVVKARGEAMQAAADATPSAMTAILAVDKPAVESLVAAARAAGPLEIANLLCPGNIVVSGALPAIEKFEELAKDQGKTVRLAVAGAFHTELMRPADQALARVLETVPLQRPRVPVWSNVDGRPHDDPQEIRSLLVRQVLQPVLWEQTLRGLLESGYDRFVEIGPGPVLAGLLKRVQRKMECRHIPA
jgi:[acyl-carrier-protein] S-malonyltransferase